MDARNGITSRQIKKNQPKRTAEINDRGIDGSGNQVWIVIVEVEGGRGWQHQPFKTREEAELWVRWCV